MTDEEMVDYLARCLVDPSSARPSIETLLHAFLPARAVLHTHADAILALTNNRRAAKRPCAPASATLSSSSPTAVPAFASAATWPIASTPSPTRRASC